MARSGRVNERLLRQPAALRPEPGAVTVKREGRRLLPSTSAFATFEVAARHLSFTTAARELHVTQAAVSQHIRRLEKSLGMRLFERRHRRLELTGEGAELLRAVGRSLDGLTEAISRLERSDERIVTVSATTSVASQWLRNLIYRYGKTHPSVRFVVLASDEDDALRNFADVDLALICGNERCEVGEELHFLFPETVRPVCSPDYMTREGPFDDPEKLTGVHLLHLHESHWASDAIDWKPLTWANWFASRGLSYHDRPGKLTTNSYSMLIDAAIDGEGVILGWQHLVQHHLEAGRLQLANEHSLRVERGNFVKLNRESADRHDVREFLAFVIEQAQQLEPW